MSTSSALLPSSEAHLSCTRELERLEDVARNCRYVASKGEADFFTEALLQIADECERTIAELNAGTGGAMVRRKYDVSGMDDLGDVQYFATDDRERAQEVLATMREDLEDVELRETE